MGMAASLPKNMCFSTKSASCRFYKRSEHLIWLILLRFSKSPFYMRFTSKSNTVIPPHKNIKKLIYWFLELDNEVRPVLLNDRLSVEHYNGGCQSGLEEHYGIKNVLQLPGQHCSNRGNNFDLILKAPNGVRLTNMCMYYLHCP